MKKRNFFLFVVFFFTWGTVLFPAEVIKGFLWGHGALVFDHQGNFYLGYDAHSISKYSPVGELLVRIGQQGEGPGDIKRISRYAFNPKDNALYITEYYNGNQWISRFSTDGRFIGAWNLEFKWSQFTVVSEIDFDKEGNVYLVTEKDNIRNYKDYNISNKDYDLLKYSPGGKLLKRIYSLNIDHSAEKVGNFQVTIPFQNALSWVLCGDKVVVKELSGDSIQVFSSDGKLEKKIPFPLKSEKVTGQDIDTWEKHMNSLPFIKNLKALGKADVRYWRESLNFPGYKPNSSWQILSDSKRNVYLRENTRYSEKDPTWVKVDIQSGKADTLKFKSGETLVQVYGDHYYFYKASEEKGEEVETIIKLSEEEFNKR